MPRRVLVIDDSDHIRQMLSWHIASREDLAMCGEAEHGAAGVEAALASRPDVIILDQEMPVLDGLGALAQLRAQLPEATIVMFSSAADPSVRVRALHLGADAFFEKGPQELIRLMTFLTAARPPFRPCPPSAAPADSSTVAAPH